ncbi:hypothetical protein [Nocardia sp. NPDC057030]|uniref:hypothetical protein n=1 Tax=unclassified Nocardia TaxID=2637762 RepID=UPI003627741C
MRKVPGTTAALAVLVAGGVVLAGPATAIDAVAIAKCSEKSKDYDAFKKCVHDVIEWENANRPN